MSSLDCMEIGEIRETSSVLLESDAALDFAKAFDPQAIHTSEEEAQRGFFGALTASGWHVCSLTMRLAVEARPFGDKPLIGAELCNIRFSRPIFHDTEIFARIRFDTIEPARKSYEYALLEIETIDRRSADVLVRQRWRMLWS